MSPVSSFISCQNKILFLSVLDGKDEVFIFPAEKGETQQFP